MFSDYLGTHASLQHRDGRSIVQEPYNCISGLLRKRCTLPETCTVVIVTGDFQMREWAHQNHFSLCRDDHIPGYQSAIIMSCGMLDQVDRETYNIARQ